MSKRRPRTAFPSTSKIAEELAKMSLEDCEDQFFENNLARKPKKRRPIQIKSELGVFTIFEEETFGYESPRPLDEPGPSGSSSSSFVPELRPRPASEIALRRDRIWEEGTNKVPLDKPCMGRRMQKRVEEKPAPVLPEIPYVPFDGPHLNRRKLNPNEEEVVPVKNEVNFALPNAYLCYFSDKNPKATQSDPKSGRQYWLFEDRPVSGKKVDLPVPKGPPIFTPDDEKFWANPEEEMNDELAKRFTDEPDDDSSDF